MNKNINLVDILKDCPKGYKLYSTIYGEVKFEGIINDKNYPIVFKYSDIACEFHVGSVTNDGRHKVNNSGECTLFPAKDQRDWSKFYIKSELIDGKIYFCKTEFNEWIYIYKKNNTFETNHYVAVLNYNFLEVNNICTTQNEGIKVLRNATEEEKRMLFKIIELNGRKWDADKKELVRIEPKFNTSTLQPFDKVLVRDMNTQKWHCNLFERIDEDTKYSFLCLIGRFHQCVPYNEETKYLLDSTKMASEKYVTWI
jgi:hypothetical protein